MLTVTGPGIWEARSGLDKSAVHSLINQVMQNNGKYLLVGNVSIDVKETLNHLSKAEEFLSKAKTDYRSYELSNKVSDKSILLIGVEQSLKAAGGCACLYARDINEMGDFDELPLTFDIFSSAPHLKQYMMDGYESMAKSLYYDPD